MPIIVNQSSLKRSSAGSKTSISGTFSFTLYETSGPLITAAQLGLTQVETFIADQEGGFVFDPEVNTNGDQINVKAFQGSGGSGFLSIFADLSILVFANIGSIAGAGLVQNVFADVGGGGVPNTAMVLIPGVVPPGPGQVSVNISGGTLLFFPGDMITTAIATFSLAATSTSGGAGSEVPNATDLSPIGNIEFTAIGL